MMPEESVNPEAVEPMPEDIEAVEPPPLPPQDEAEGELPPPLSFLDEETPPAFPEAEAPPPLPEADEPYYEAESAGDSSVPDPFAEASAEPFPEPISPGSVPPSPPPAAGKSTGNNRTLIIVLIVALVLVLCCCCTVVGLVVLGMWDTIAYELGLNLLNLPLLL